MATETLKIVITADNKQALESLKQTTLSLEGVSVVSTQTSSRMGQLSTSSNSAAFALTNVGRVAQDLPFGFMGIQNNLNPLLESFQRLKAESGSTGGALKALGGSLMGAGGLGLALSVASAAILIFQNGMMGFNKKTKESTEAIDGEAKAMMALNAEAGKTFVSVAQLVAVDQTQITSIKQKQKLIEDLQNISTTYFGNLKIEKGEIVGLAQAYQLYADNIFRVAQAKGAAKQAEKLSTRLVDVTGQINELDQNFNQLGKNQSLIGGLDAAKKKTQELNILTSKGAFLNFEEQKRIAELTGKSENEIRQYLDKKNGLKTEELRLTGQILDLSKQMPKNENVNDFSNKNASLTKTEQILKSFQDTIDGLNNQLATGFIGKDLFDADKLKAYNTALEALSKNGESSIFIFDELASEQEILFKRAFEAKMKMQSLQSEDISNPFEKTTTPGTPKFINGVPQSLEDIQAQQDKINQAQQAKLGKKSEADRIEAINKALTETKGLMTVVNPLVDTLFTAMQNGTDIGQALGDTFKKLAEDIAKAALKALIFDTILSALTGGTSGGLKKAGGFLGSIMGFAKGGISEGPQGGHMELLHGTEAILTPAQMSGLVRNSMNAGAVTSMGNNSQQQGNTQGEFTLRGNDLVLALQRSNYSLNLRRGV